MDPRHQVSRGGIALIKRFEGLRREAARLDDGRWTIGYGHTRTARAGATVDERDAEALLLYDLIGVAHAVNEWSHAPLNQHQFDALVSFAFNIGLENFRRSLTLRRLNEGRMVEAALAMELWRRADFEGERIVIDALVRRRAYEKTLFLKPVDSWALAPTPVLPPKLDYDVASVMPSRPPTVVTTKMEGGRAEIERPPSEPAAPQAPSEEAQSASIAAAAALSARLDAIAPDEPQETPEETTALLPLEELHAGPDAVEDEVAPADETLTDGAPEDPAPADEAPATVTTRPSLDLRNVPLFEAPSGPRPRNGPVPLFLLGLAGVALFVIAVNFGFRSPVPGAPPFAGGLFGWVFGGAGIACFALAAYFLLVRLGEGDRGPHG